MTKTEYLEDAIEREFARALESGEMIAPEVDGAEYQRAPEGLAAFPSPTADWGKVTHVAMPNPRRRWWSFWRPRVVVITKPVQMILGSGAVGYSSTGTLEGDMVIAPV